MFVHLYNIVTILISAARHLVYGIYCDRSMLSCMLVWVEFFLVSKVGGCRYVVVVLVTIWIYLILENVYSVNYDIVK